MRFSDQEPDLTAIYRSCELCPRTCRVDRTHGNAGFCGETARLRVAHVGPHFGEEPPITGTHGSGAVFFSGCSLQCTFCQNHQISRGGMGKIIGLHQLIEKIKQMILIKKVHNLNFVTPDHFTPHIVQVVSRLRRENLILPTVYNFSGYQSEEMLKSLEKYADIYLPDFKYSDSALAGRLSQCADYPQKAITAISEMVRQKGFLDGMISGSALATKGVLVRHLILPGAIENSIEALTILFIEFGANLPISLMSQYYPVVRHKNAELNRTITDQEFGEVYDHANQLGFQHMFVQFPEPCPDYSTDRPSFLPDFKNKQPFASP